ncbi:MAG: thioredoxin [Bacteroidales bacterium]|jgi:thioredoxin|nr:thioredoxin [Bacteroidales bacterium]
MKKLTFFLFFLGALTFNACSGNAGNNDGIKETNEGEVVHLTAESFQKLVWDYKKNPNDWIFVGDQPCIIDFYADWCRPCKMVAPIMVELSNEYKGKVRIYKVNTDEQRELAQLFNVSSIPAVLFVPRSGKPQMAVGAMQKPAYIDAIKNVLQVK